MFTALLEILADLDAQPLLVVLLMAAGALAESGLGIGALLPGETIVATGATILAGQPVLWLAWVLVAAAAFAGDHVGYVVGRRLGPSVSRSGPVRTVGVARWERVTGMMRRRAVPTLAVGRLVPGVRTLLALAAGGAGVRYRWFALGSSLGALIWSAVWVGGVATIGRFLLGLDPIGLVLAGAAVLLVVLIARARRRVEVPREI